jgi:hypothetical protein
MTVSHEKPQETPLHLSKERTTIRVYLQELRKRLEENHGKCAEALTKKATTDAQAAVVVSVHTPNVMQVMMLFQQAQHRAKAS